MYITFNQSSEILACIVSAIAFSKLDIFAKLIAIQVFIALIIELIGLQIRIRHNSNIWLYNCYLLLEFPFLFLASELGENKSSFKQIIIVVFVYVAGWIFEVYLKSIDLFVVKTYIFGAIILMVSYCFVLYNSAKNLNSLFLQSRFWFAIGIILFFGCNIPFFSMHDYIANQSNLSQMRLLTLLMTVFAHIRYLCMAIGFIIVLKEKRK